MIIRNKEKLKRKRTIPYLIFFFLYSIAIYTTQPLYKDALFEISLNLTSHINSNMELQNYLAYFNTFAVFLGSHHLCVILTIFIYNIGNIFKTFIFLSSVSIMLFFAGILKMIYQSPMMYYSEFDANKYGSIIPMACNTSWGVPSTHAMSTVTVYLTLWKIIFDCSRLRYKKYVKIIALLMFSLLILFVNFCTFLSALHSIDQILFGTLIGFQIFFFIFYVLNVDLNDGKFLLKIVKFKSIFYLTICLVLLSGVLTLYFLPQNDEKFKLYENNIKNNSKCSNDQQNLSLNNDALMLCCIFFCSLGMIFGMKYEYRFIFNKNEMNWRQYNFDKENGDEDSLLSKLSITKESQWNHTTVFFTCLRFLAILPIQGIILIPYWVINIENNLVIVILFKVFLPIFLNLFFMFCLEKTLLRKIGVTNDAIFKLLNESL